jgi:FlaG/FlaF family flagellin (archaellin)
MKATTKIRRSIKAVSPVISVLLMIVVAVAASLIAYAWIMGYMGGTTSKVGKAIQIQSYYTNPAGTELYVYVQNVGQGTVEFDPTACVYVNDDGMSADVSPAVSLEPGSTATFTITGLSLDVTNLVKIKVVTTDGTFTEVKGYPHVAEGGANLAPSLTGVPSSTVTVDEGATVTFDADATDPDVPPQTLTFSLNSAPPTATIDSVTGEFSWSTTEDDGGNDYTFTVRVTDDGIPALYDEASVTIHVNEVTDQQEVSASYSTSDGSTPSTSVELHGTHNGAPVTLTLTTSSQLISLDDGTSWSVDNPVPASPTTERWYATSGTSGTVEGGTTINPSYYHQYSVTFQYTISGTPTGSPTNPTATYSQFGSSATTSATRTTPPSDWVDTASAVTYTNPLAGSTGTERWKISPEASASPYTVIASVSSSTTANPTYYHQYLLTVTASPSSTPPLGGSFTVQYTKFGLTTSPSHDTEWQDWADASTTPTVTVSDPESPVGSYTFNDYTNNGATMNSAQTVTINYNNPQIGVTFKETGVSSDAGSNLVLRVDVGNDGSWDYSYTQSQLAGAGSSISVSSGTAIKYEFQSPVATSDSGKRYAWLSGAGTGNFPTSSSQTGIYTITQASTITGNYKTECKVTFAQTGLGSDATGTVVTVAGSPKTRTDLPFSTWIDASTGSVSYSYTTTVTSSVSGKDYPLTTPAPSPESPVTGLSGPVTVTGTYNTKIVLSPTANSGDFSNAGNAYADDSNYATSDSRYDDHTYYGYADIPTGATVSQVRVRLDAWTQSGGSDDRDDISLSVYDGGWHSYGTISLTTSQATSWCDVTSLSSGGWTYAEVNDIQASVSHVRDGSYTEDVYLDWIPVEVTYFYAG